MHGDTAHELSSSVLNQSRLVKPVLRPILGHLTLLAGILLLFGISAPLRAQQYQWSNFAGMPGGRGNTDGAGSAARFFGPSGVAVDGNGNIYVADSYNNIIRKIAPGGVVSSLAGSAGQSGSSDGTGSAARFWRPSGVAVDGIGNIYVADSANNTIRKITPAGVVSTLAGSAGQSGSSEGTGSAARFSNPTGVAVDGSGNVYVADKGNNKIRKVTPAGEVSTLAGNGLTGSSDGLGSSATFYQPAGVAVDSSGNVYVAELVNQTIRRITPAGLVSTLAGSASQIGSSDGTGSAARFWQPAGVAVDGSGTIYVAESGNNTIRKITPGGAVSTLAGSALQIGSNDGTGSAARFYGPSAVAVDGSGNMYVADNSNNTIRKITAAGVVNTLAGIASQPGSSDGTGAAASFNYPHGVAVDGNGNVYVADNYNSTIRKVTPAGLVSTLAGSTGQGGNVDGIGSTARFSGPSGVAVDGSGNVYVAQSSSLSTIRKITPAGVVSTLAGNAFTGSNDGTGSAASFRFPMGVAVDGSGNVYVADNGNNKIRKITPAGVVSTLAGIGLTGSSDGTGSAARFNGPIGVAVDGSGNVYVADYGNHTIRKITPAGVVSTLAGSAGQFGSSDGTGSAARFSNPTGVAVDGSGNVYVADIGNNTIRKITPAGVVSTIGGTALIAGGADGNGAAAVFCEPYGITVSPTGALLYVSDRSNNSISMGQIGSQPLLTVASVTGLGSTTATLNGTVNPNGAATIAWFAYGVNTDHDSTVALTLSPNNGSAAQNVSATLTGLSPGTTYRYYLTGINAAGNYDTPDYTFTTLPSAMQTWRQTWFGTTANTGNAASTADPFHTGVQNLAAFSFFGPNQNPATVSVTQLPQPQRSRSSFSYNFTEPVGMSGVTYGAEWKSDLAASSWTPINDTGSGTTHIFSVPLTGNPNIFMRLRLSGQ